MKYSALLLPTLLALASCGGGGGGGSSSTPTADNSVSERPADSTSGTPPANSPASSRNNSCSQLSVGLPSLGSTVILTGAISYDRVPLNRSNGLDYRNTRRQPARGIQVQAVDNAGNTIATTATNNAGEYRLSVPKNSQVSIRARAELLSTSAARWNVRIQDNTANNALYAMNATISDTGNSNLSCDLYAASGWNFDTGRYGNRTAAPFAIADTIYNAIQANVAVDSAVIMPPLQVNWSPRNTPATNCRGGVAAGCIGTSYYFEGELFFLGAANIDSDEYDAHVVSHEWGHYFEDKLSRNDSMGGQHDGTAKLDMRVALAEGFATAMSGIFEQSDTYRDSSGSKQASGFSIDIEANEASGWFNEDSVQSVIYDIADSRQDGSDNLAVGWEPIYRSVTSSAFRQSAAATSIFSVLDALVTDRPDLADRIRAMAATRGINSSDSFAAGERNSAGGGSDVLPVHSQLRLGVPTALCSTNRYGDNNKLSVTRFSYFDVSAPGRFTFTASGGTDPDLRLTLNGEELAVFDRSGSESASLQLSRPGRYSLEVSEACFKTPGARQCSNLNSSRSCFEISVDQS